VPQSTTIISFVKTECDAQRFEPDLFLLFIAVVPMLKRVDLAQFCLRCGASLYGDTCPQCGTVARQVPNKARRDNFAVWLIAGIVVAVVLELAVSAMLIHRYLGKRDLANLAAPVFLHHKGPVAPLDQLKGSGRIYLVQMGPHNAPYSVDQLADWLKTKYHLDVAVLPPTGVDASAWDPSRKQYVAELLYRQLKWEHPDLAADPHAYLYGFIDADMYSVNYFWEFTHTQRDHKRAAVVSAARMQDTPSERRGVSDAVASEHLQQRLRRLLLKDVAVQYWQLPQNNDPTSLLHRTVNPDLPTEDIYASDLDPEHASTGRPEGEPCIFLRYSSKDGIAPVAGPLIRSCTDFDDSTPDQSQETFELDLRLGLLMDRHFDFYLPDTVPIEFERVTRDGWVGPMGFGISGTNNYDSFLQSKDMVLIELIKPDGGRMGLKRTPNFPLPLSQLRYVDTDYSGKMYELRWYSTPFGHFDLRKFNGEVQTYLPCQGSVICYQIGYRNADGQELTFQRDEQRRLLRLTSPAKEWISLTYGPANTIAEISDSHNRTVRYGYDDRKRLISVTYPSGAIYSYQYDDGQHLLTFSVAPDAETPARTILRNTYENGRLATQTLADGSVYKYSYEESRGTIRMAYVSTPDGSVFQVRLLEDGSTIWERGTPSRQPKPAMTADSSSTRSMIQ
jgi:YD repeat-containing protein